MQAEDIKLKQVNKAVNELQKKLGAVSHFVFTKLCERGPLALN
jgi:hypothetical protein